MFCTADGSIIVTVFHSNLSLFSPCNAYTYKPTKYFPSMGDDLNLFNHVWMNVGRFCCSCFETQRQTDGQTDTQTPSSANPYPCLGRETERERKKVEKKKSRGEPPLTSTFCCYVSNEITLQGFATFGKVRDLKLDVNDNFIFKIWNGVARRKSICI